MPMASLLSSPPFSPLRSTPPSTPTPFFPRSNLLPLPPSSSLTPSTPSRPNRNRSPLPCRAKHIDFGHWVEESKQLLSGVNDSIKELCEDFPQHAKSFPWTTVAAQFAGIVWDLVFSVAKYLCVPVLAVSCLSEMSYCAHERKMMFIPIPFLVGVGVAVALNDTVVELSPDLQEGVPWHLIAMGTSFVLLKLLGPYYPYLLRLVVPHFANGGLWSILWFSFLRHKMDSGKVERKAA